MGEATVKEKIKAMLVLKKYGDLREYLSHINGADIVLIFNELPEENIPVLFRLLQKDTAAQVFAMMDSDRQEMLIRGFSDNEIHEVFDELYVDDAADIVEEMPANVVKRILKNTDAQTRRMINEILKYPEDSAGSLMNTEYISLRPDMTVVEAKKRIRRVIADAETVYICFVTDSERRLMGLISIKTLLLANDDEIIQDIIDDTDIYVYTTTDKEDVAKAMNKYDLVAMPVVDAEMRLVGMVMFDDAIDVMQDETTEDIEKMAAIAPHEESYFKTSDIKHAKNRIVWLLILMLSSSITGIIISNYEAAFASHAILVSFIPMIMGTGGNCGSQSATLIIRGMSVDDIKLKDFLRVVWTEFRVSVIISAALAAFNAVRIMIQYGDAVLAAVISLSIVGTVILSQFIGCMLPMAAKRLKLDPAVMASPLITTIVDVASLMIYFSIATKFFNI
ncbi:MAG: magnesium transporter [Firmicutes bacterium]|nr:magnesium transporter [Bacillota bacterium]